MPQLSDSFMIFILSRKVFTCFKGHDLEMKLDFSEWMDGNLITFSCLLSECYPDAWVAVLKCFALELFRAVFFPSTPFAITIPTTTTHLTITTAFWGSFCWHNMLYTLYYPCCSPALSFKSHRCQYHQPMKELPHQLRRCKFASFLRYLLVSHMQLICGHRCLYPCQFAVLRMDLIWYCWNSSYCGPVDSSRMYWKQYVCRNCLRP